MINFSRAKVTTNAALDQLAAGDRLQRLAPLDPALLKRIREAAMMSNTLQLELADILLDQELID